MIIDSIENIEKYKGLHPLFPQAIDYLTTTDLNAVPTGSVIRLNGADLVAGFSRTEPKSKEQAKLETHNQFIDIQIPLSGVEIIGYTPLSHLPGSDYNAEKDISFYEGPAENYLAVKPGMFVIFWPEDGHAPGISEDGVRKIVVKVLA